MTADKKNAFSNYPHAAVEMAPFHCRHTCLFTTLLKKIDKTGTFGAQERTAPHSWSYSFASYLWSGLPWNRSLSDSTSLRSSKVSRCISPRKGFKWPKLNLSIGRSDILRSAVDDSMVNHHDRFSSLRTSKEIMMDRECHAATCIQYRLELFT